MSSWMTSIRPRRGLSGQVEKSIARPWMFRASSASLSSPIPKVRASSSPKLLVHEAPPELPAGTPGTVGWHELYATEWKAAFAFYEKMFGWTKAEAIDMGPMGTYRLFATGDVPVGGMMTKPETIPMPYWGYYFNVAGLDAAAARVTAGGGKIMNGPMEVPGGQWIVNCMDPQNATFSLVAMKR